MILYFYHKHCGSAAFQWKDVPSAQALPSDTTGADVATQHTHTQLHTLTHLTHRTHTHTVVSAYTPPSNTAQQGGFITIQVTVRTG